LQTIDAADRVRIDPALVRRLADFEILIAHEPCRWLVESSIGTVMVSRRGLRASKRDH